MKKKIQIDIIMIMGLHCTWYTNINTINKNKAIGFTGYNYEESIYHNFYWRISQ